MSVGSEHKAVSVSMSGAQELGVWSGVGMGWGRSSLLPSERQKHKVAQSWNLTSDENKQNFESQEKIRVIQGVRAVRSCLACWGLVNKKVWLEECLHDSEKQKF